MTRSDIIAILVAVGAALTWYLTWVRPHDAVLASIQNCMGDDTSRSAFDRCWEAP